MKLDFSTTPFSAPGSYLAISRHAKGDRWQASADGLYLRTVHANVSTPFICRFVPICDGMPIEDFTCEMDPAELRVSTQSGEIRFCFAGERTILMRTQGAGLSVRLDFLAEGTVFNHFTEMPCDGRTLWMANADKNLSRFVLDPQRGALSIDQEWKISSSLRMAAEIAPASGEGSAQLAIHEVRTEWDGKPLPKDYDGARALQAASFEKFLDAMPSVPAEFANARIVASHLLWSTYVLAEGFLLRPALYMSKNWMTRVWSWDHCFNALALNVHLPELAWSQFMVLFDLQDPTTGAVPDCACDGQVFWGFCKPPIHGWALRRMMAEQDIPPSHLAEAYDRIGRWTEWWFSRRDLDHNGLCEYNHGNDSGWDNSTAFALPPPVELPDLQAFLAIQMDVLGELAEKLDKRDEAAAWRKRSDELIARMAANCFDADGMPIARRAYSREVVPCDSLILYLPILLGKRLPERIRATLVRELASDRFLTEWGYATESPKSPAYESDGYWRGPIWAPSTLLILDGLRACGEEALARRVAERFALMFARSGSAENFDAQTGEGLRDRAYTWTASAFLVIAHDYLES